MLIDAFWFNSAQGDNVILQPNFFIPKTHLGLYAEGDFSEFPVYINISVIINNTVVFEKELFLSESNSCNEEYKAYIDMVNGSIVCRFFSKTLDMLPDCIKVIIKTGDNIYSSDICCEYATLTGKIIDFYGNPFPAALVLNRTEFEGMETGLGTWSDSNGVYSIIVPRGIYNAFFIDDSSYGKTSLENWCWHMIVDRDEKQDFKIGNGEVYSLCAWANNGGPPTLQISFRPMVLPPEMKPKQYQVEINDKTFAVTDAYLDLKIENITATINGYELKNISLQKIYETGDAIALPSYILQVSRIPEREGYSTVGKQTLIVEYDLIDKDGCIGQSQGRTQFFYTDSNALSIK